MFRNSIVPITAGVMLALAGSAQAAGTRTDHVRRDGHRRVELLHYDSASAMAFGNYDGSARRSTRMSAIAVRCSKNAAYTIALNAGDARQASLRSDCCRPAAKRWSTTCYSDAGPEPVWGNTVGSHWVTGTGTGLGNADQVTHTVYGQSAQQRGQPGGRGRRLLATRSRPRSAY